MFVHVEITQATIYVDLVFVKPLIGVTTPSCALRASDFAASTAAANPEMHSS